MCVLNKNKPVTCESSSNLVIVILNWLSSVECDLLVLFCVIWSTKPQEGNPECWSRWVLWCHTQKQWEIESEQRIKLIHNARGRGWVNWVYGIFTLKSGYLVNMYFFLRFYLPSYFYSSCKSPSPALLLVGLCNQLLRYFVPLPPSLHMDVGVSFPCNPIFFSQGQLDEWDATVKIKSPKVVIGHNNRLLLKQMILKGLSTFDGMPLPSQL